MVTKVPNLFQLSIPYPDYSILVGASSMVLVVGYPLAKRYTDWPQVVLGKLIFDLYSVIGIQIEIFFYSDEL